MESSNIANNEIINDNKNIGENFYSNFTQKKKQESDNLQNTFINNGKEAEQFCKCKSVSIVYSDTESSNFGYWDVCGTCNKKIEDGFHYYNHYDGEDHDDIDLYC